MHAVETLAMLLEETTRKPGGFPYRVPILCDIDHEP